MSFPCPANSVSEFFQIVWGKNILFKLSHQIRYLLINFKRQASLLVGKPDKDITRKELLQVNFSVDHKYKNPKQTTNKLHLYVCMCVYVLFILGIQFIIMSEKQFVIYHINIIKGKIILIDA